MIKKIISTLLLMIFCVLSSKGQVSINIDSIELNYAIVSKKKDIWISDFGGGPSLTMFISLENQSSKTLTIMKNDRYQLFCEYYHEGFPYKSIEFYIFNDGGDILSIPQNGNHKETVTISIFIPYYFLEMDNYEIYDYTNGLNEVLSTIRLVLFINDKRYVSNSKPILKKGDFFFFEYN